MTQIIAKQRADKGGQTFTFQVPDAIPGLPYNVQSPTGMKYVAVALNEQGNIASGKNIVGQTSPLIVENTTVWHVSAAAGAYLHMPGVSFVAILEWDSKLGRYKASQTGYDCYVNNHMTNGTRSVSAIPGVSQLDELKNIAAIVKKQGKDSKGKYPDEDVVKLARAYNAALHAMGITPQKLQALLATPAPQTAAATK